MSGGSLNYIYRSMDSAAFDVESRAETPLHHAFASHLRKVAKALHDLEWVWSSDYGPGDGVEAIRAVLGEGAEIEAATERAEKALADLTSALSANVRAERGPTARRRWNKPRPRGPFGMNDMPGVKNKKGKKMKPLKIAIKEDVNDDNSKIFMAFIRPDAIRIVCELKDHPDLCAIKGDGEDAYTIIDEPFLEFVARWQLALM